MCKPGIVTSVVETAEQLLDQRHLDGEKLASMLEQAKEASMRFAAEEQIEVKWERIWSIEPILFDETLVGFATRPSRRSRPRLTGSPRGHFTMPPRSPAQVSRR